MAMLLYIIYVLDQPTIAHKKCNHKNDYNENENCEGNSSINYIDDNESQIVADSWMNIQDETNDFLRNQKEYHDNNELVFNEEKTVIMFNTNIKKIKRK